LASERSPRRGLDPHIAGGNNRRSLLLQGVDAQYVAASTVAGKTHDKKAADEAPIAYPLNATLDKDTGFQGYEPPGVLTQQPKKSLKAKS
jgi:hypothetical protein